MNPKVWAAITATQELKGLHFTPLREWDSLDDELCWLTGGPPSPPADMCKPPLGG